MHLIPWNTVRDFDHMRRELSNWLDWPSRVQGALLSPRVDVYQTESDVIVKAEIPGVAKEDLELYIDDNSLRLSGTTKREQELNEENVYRTERYYGSFSRTIPFPVAVKPDEATAEYRDGILSVTVPKVKPSKPTGRRLDIK